MRTIALKHGFSHLLKTGPKDPGTNDCGTLSGEGHMSAQSAGATKQVPSIRRFEMLAGSIRLPNPMLQRTQAIKLLKICAPGAGACQDLGRELIECSLRLRLASVRVYAG